MRNVLADLALEYEGSLALTLARLRRADHTGAEIAAVLAGDKAKLARHAEKIRGHTLDSYLAFWRLRLRLEEADPRELKDFLTRNEGSVLAERLRRDWLLVLGKRGHWEIFREEHSALVKTDPDVACYALQEGWRRQDASVFAEIKSLFMAPRTLPATSSVKTKVFTSVAVRAPCCSSA